MSDEPFDPEALRARRRRFWFMFCERNGVGDGVPLFATDGDPADGVVRVRKIGAKRRPVFTRHPDMEAMVLAEAQKVIADHEARGRTTDGLITCIYTAGEDGPEPLYLGTVPREESDGKLSRLLRGINAGDTHGFARWGYGKAAYFGALSNAALGAQPLDHRRSKYGRWAHALFAEPTRDRRLRQPVRFWTRAWDPSLRGPWLDFGPTNLVSLHAQLVAVATDGYPDRLLPGADSA